MIERRRCSNNADDCYNDEGAESDSPLCMTSDVWLMAQNSSLSNSHVGLLRPVP